MDVVLERPLTELARDALDARDVDVAQRDVETVRVQPARDLLADAGCASDDRVGNYSIATRSPTATWPGSATSHHTPKGSGSVVSMSARYSAITSSVWRSR